MPLDTLRIQLPFLCERPEEEHVPPGVILPDGPRIHYVDVTEQVLTVRLTQRWDTRGGRDASKLAMLRDIRAGRIHGMTEAEVVEQHDSDNGEDDPYTMLEVQGRNGLSHSLYWIGNGDYDGYDMDVQRESAESGEA